MKTIRRDDNKLITILQSELQSYTEQPIPLSGLENAVELVISHIRESSRRQENILWIDTSSRWSRAEKTLFYQEQEIALTNKEREILAILFENANKAVSYEVISLNLWNEILDPFLQKRIKTLIKQIRKKLPLDIIKNLFGYGYKIELQESF